MYYTFGFSGSFQRERKKRLDRKYECSDKNRYSCFGIQRIPEPCFLLLASFFPFHLDLYTDLAIAEKKLLIPGLHFREMFSQLTQTFLQNLFLAMIGLVPATKKCLNNTNIQLMKFLFASIECFGLQKLILCDPISL